MGVESDRVSDGAFADARSGYRIGIVTGMMTTIAIQYRTGSGQEGNMNTTEERRGRPQCRPAWFEVAGRWGLGDVQTSRADRSVHRCRGRGLPADKRVIAKEERSRSIRSEGPRQNRTR